MKIRGGEFGFPLGTYSKSKKTIKNHQGFPFRFDVQFWDGNSCAFFDNFYFWKSIFKIVERTFLHESDTFKVPLKKRGGELTFSRLGCQHLKISLRWMHPQRLKKKIAFSPRRCRNSKKSLRWMHPQRLNFWTMPGTAVGATFWSSKVGPEWSLFCMALTFLMEKYENRNATADQQAGSQPRVRILQRR